MLPTTTPHNAAVVNPIQIHISEEKIELLVFPPFRPLDGDSYFSPRNYAPHQRFLIDDKAAKTTTGWISFPDFSLAA